MLYDIDDESENANKAVLEFMPLLYLFIVMFSQKHAGKCW